MNIKTGTEILRPVEVPVSQRTKTSGSDDREHNLGGHPGSGQQDEELTEEEFKEAIEHLRALPGIKNNNLLVRVEQKMNVRIVLVTDLKGKIFRRIASADLKDLLKNRDQSKGQLLDKAL